MHCKMVHGGCSERYLRFLLNETGLSGKIFAISIDDIEDMKFNTPKGASFNCQKLRLLHQGDNFAHKSLNCEEVSI